MNPYENLPFERFWRTGVVAPAHEGIIFNGLWRSRFPIDKKTQFITVGSCFAQHISSWLRNHGYAWIDSEPAPETLPGDQIADDGYGVFSFRTGNIYTPALLKQWIFQSLGLIPLISEYHKDGQYFIDPFRPAIPKKGFLTVDELHSQKKHTLQCIYQALQKADIFIFTLGLTEAWEHVNGYVYPMCPGTVKGQFNPNNHVFVNYTHDQITKDLAHTFDAIKRINPTIKFLLTVSPVPLTATASKEHVLVATTYSKSILRSAAGELSLSRDDVDYFPSYELISQPPTFGKFYESNLRSVKPEGVDYVMKHFELGIDPDFNKEKITPPVKTKLYKSIDEICEDILLENQSKDIKRVNSISTNIFFLGDSHMGILSGIFKKMGLSCIGDMTMKGHIWANNQFILDQDEVFIPLESMYTRKNWIETYEAMTACSKNTKYVFTNIGIQANFNIPKIVQMARSQNRNSLSPQDVCSFFLEINKPKLAILEKLIQQGFTCIVITDPPTQGLNPQFKQLEPLISLYESEACKCFSAIGCDTLNVREIYPSGIPSNFYRDERFQFAEGQLDYVHGSDDFYVDLAKIIIERYQLN